MNKLHDKTPQQLNIMVAEIKGEPSKAGFSLDYCDDDALAFRLMVENSIELEFDAEMPRATYWYSEDKISALNENPRRAIVECFILMNQHKEG